MSDKNTIKIISNAKHDFKWIPFLPILFWPCGIIVSVAMVWSVESLPSNLAARVRFPAGSGILISVLGLGVCPLCSVLVVFGGGPDIVLTTYSGRLALVYLSSVLVQRLLLPYRHLTHRHLTCKSLGCKS